MWLVFILLRFYSCRLEPPVLFCFVHSVFCHLALPLLQLFLSSNIFSFFTVFGDLSTTLKEHPAPLRLAVMHQLSLHVHLLLLCLYDCCSHRWIWPAEAGVWRFRVELYRRVLLAWNQIPCTSTHSVVEIMMLPAFEVEEYWRVEVWNIAIKFIMVRTRGAHFHLQRSRELSDEFDSPSIINCTSRHGRGL